MADTFMGAARKEVPDIIRKAGARWRAGAPAKTPLPLPFEKAVHRFKRGTDYGDKGMGASSVAGL